MIAAVVVDKQSNSTRSIPSFSGFSDDDEKNVSADNSIVQIFRRIDELEREGTLSNSQAIEALFDELARRPFEPDLIEGIVQRGGKPISLGEKRLISLIRRNFPDFNRTLVSYDLLRRNTDHLDLRRFEKEFIDVYGTLIEVHKVGGSRYRFLVHAARVDEGSVGNILEEKKKVGFLCASVISDECPYFFKDDHYFAIVLSANPSQVVATCREDAFSPSQKDGETTKYYRERLRLSLLTSWIDKLFRESGVLKSQSRTTDEFSQLNRIMSSGDSAMLADGSSSIRALRKTVLCNQPLERNKFFYERQGISRKQIEESLRFAQTHPCHINPGIQADLQRCEQMMNSAKSISEELRQLHPIQSPEELLRQTPFQKRHGDNQSGKRPYNEINLLCETQGQSQIRAKAVLINRRSYLLNPNRYRDVLLQANFDRVPILFIENPSDRKSHQDELLRAILLADRLAISDLLGRGEVDDPFKRDAFLIAIKLGNWEIFSCLLSGWRRLPQPIIEELFQSALRDEGLMKQLLQSRKDLFMDRALNALEFLPDKVAVNVALYLFSLGARVPSRFAPEMYCFAIREKNGDLALKIRWSYEEEIPEEVLKAAWKEGFALDPKMTLDVLPEAHLGWAFATCIESRYYRALDLILETDWCRDRLSWEDLEQGLQKAVEVRVSNRLILKMMQVRPEFSMRLAELAYSWAVAAKNSELIASIKIEFPSL